MGVVGIEGDWQKSSACSSAECVEVRTVDAGRWMRSRSSFGSAQVFVPRQVWRDFVRAVRRGDYEAPR